MIVEPGMKPIREFIRNWQLLVVTGLACLFASGCESMIDGIGDRLTHDSDVRDYEHHGFSHQDAERRVYEDNFFEDMDRH